jgi:hypothetical protein
MNLLKFYSLLILAVATSLTARAAVIGIDALHGGNAGDTGNVGLGANYSQFRSTLTSSGNSIVNLLSFNSADLAGLDALMVTQPAELDATLYTASEISAIQNFVASGHGLVVIGEGGFNKNLTVPNLNTLVSPYGVTFAGSPLAPSGAYASNFLAHPLTVGLGSVGVDYYRPLSTISPPAVDLTITGPDFLAAVNGVGGSGNVVLLGDSSMWTNPGAGSDTPINYGSNLLLLQNTISFITVPEPSSYALMAMSLLAFRSRKRTNRP